jgi:beta-N-acetylhexosaminidase
MAQDLAPYIELFTREDDKVRAVMVSHGGFPQIDIKHAIVGGRLEPASLSYHISHTLLRGELGFDHLVLTDDLEMGAITKHYEIEESTRRAFLAGQDMLLICSREDMTRRGFDSLVDAANRGEISRDRIDESLRRIAEFKSLLRPPTPLDTDHYQSLSKEIAQLNQKLNYSYGGSVK